ncbi:UNVERIFIED_ORG: O-antigen/teichoic acid export membrane protein [Bacillus sp. PvP124]|uniref:oligosaccharide flippase family protein n=1 Tax=Priestia megaterium TaxID=1404 RepID=UPI0015D4C097|nr:oligosaccharide flippase family protein [Priestia megaterium]MDH6655958.1 O-antigen/teichoic acid export membrane protein [Bacillus sp. PvP124]
MSNNNLFKKFLDYAIGSGIVLILGFVSSPLNTRLFSPDEFGKFSMFLLVGNVINAIVLLGLDQSFVRYFYIEDEKNRGKLLYKTFKLSLIFCIFTTLLIVIFKEAFLQLISKNQSYQLLMLIGLNNFALLFNRFALLVVRMQQKGKLFSALQVIQKITNIIVILMLFFTTERNFLILAYAAVISNIVATFIGVGAEKNLWSFKNSTGKINTSYRELLKYGYPLIFTFLITWLFQSSDRLFVKYYKGYEELGIYSAAFSIIALLNAVQMAFSMFWVPVAYEKFENDSNSKSFFTQINQVVTFVMFSISVFIILFKDIIVLILGESYRSASLIIPFLVFMPLMYTISETTVLGINFRKKSQYHILIAVITAIINLIGHCIFVPKLGGIGAAISTGITYIVFFSLRTLFSKKLYKNNYNLKAFYIVTFNLVLFSTYATFNSINTPYILLGAFNIIVLLFIYRKIITNWFNYFYKNKKNLKRFTLKG